jgi:putative peptidoglycan lipid II flippase
MSSTPDETARASAPEIPAVPRSSAAASSLVAAGILLSRIAGLVRARVFAMYFGTSEYADVFNAGLRTPNALQNLLGEGTLSASFIPVYAELLEQGREEEAGRVAGAIFSLLMAIAAALSLFGVLLAPVLVSIFLPGFEGERRELTIQVVRVIFPMTGVLVLSAWALGILNSHRKYFVSYVAPVLWNGAMIGTLVFFGGRMPPSDLVVALAWGALLGAGLQFGIQIPWVLRLERELKIAWDTRLEAVREVLRNAGPAIMGRGVVQLSGYVDVFLASLLALGAVANITYAQLLYMLPVSLFGMSVAAAELPELARQRTAALDTLRDRTNQGLRRIAFYVIPSFVVFVALGDVAIGALLQTGEFGRDDTLVVYLTLVGLSLGLLASTGTRLFASTFFALRDTKTPARYAAVRVSSAAILSLLLMTQFEPIPRLGIDAGVFAGMNIGGQPLGSVGLAAGSGLAAWIEWVLIRRALRKKLGDVGPGAGPVAKMFIAALLAAAVAWGVRWMLPEIHPILLAIFVFGPFGAVYFGTAAALRVEEIAGVATRVRGMLRR